MDVTVVIPTFNRRDALVETLTALAATDYSAGRWEVVVVDDGSTDGTVDAVEAWATSRGAPVRCLRQGNTGPAAARNRGAEAACGEHLIFIDNDILVKPDFVRAHVETLRANPGCWVLGRITHPPELRSTPFGRYRNALWEAFHRLHREGQVSETSGMSAANMSLPRADFDRLGGFDEDFTIASSEDWVLGHRARRAGIRILYHPGIVALHNDWAVSLERFCERQRLYSVSDVLLWHKYGTASPRERLVDQNRPTRWGTDRPRLLFKKVVKSVLSSVPGRRIVDLALRLIEKVAPDSRLCHRGYDLAVALAIFRGVREGWRRYVPPRPTEGLEPFRDSADHRLSVEHGHASSGMSSD